MGSPLGPTLANIFLSHHEQIWLQNCPSNFKPLVYHRYVDDTFTIFSHPEHADHFLSYLNRQHPNIQFTVEIEQNNSLPFLDTLVTSSNGTFSTGIFRKSTFTGLGTNFFSNIPYKYKINAIKTLIYRAYHLTTSYLLFNVEIDFLKSFFAKNGFSTTLFEDQLRILLNKYRTSPPKLPSVEKMPFYFKLPYYNDFSTCLLYTSPSPRDKRQSRMPSSA